MLWGFRLKAERIKRGIGQAEARPVSDSVWRS